VPRGLLWLELDVGRMQQVLATLLTNACNNSPPKGEIRLMVQRDGEQVVIAIKDKGVGISAEALPKLFDLDSLAERSLARSEGGLGIGLTMVKKIVEMHKGSITVQSEGEGKGSEFTVRLPLAKRERPKVLAGESEKPRKPISTSEKRMSILVVEDNKDAAESLAQLLRTTGHECVDVVHDGHTAVETIVIKKPAVVLLDIGLPGMNGYEVADKVRGQNVTPRPYIIAVTGYGLDSDRERAKDAGIDEFMVKPLDPARLKEILSDLARKPD
jgi:CheY-like chemotaxis protein